MFSWEFWFILGSGETFLLQALIVDVDWNRLSERDNRTKLVWYDIYESFHLEYIRVILFNNICNQHRLHKHPHNRHNIEPPNSPKHLSVIFILQNTATQLQRTKMEVWWNHQIYDKQQHPHIGHSRDEVVNKIKHQQLGLLIHLQWPT